MSGDELPVHVNRKGQGSIDVAGVDGSFETRGPFELVLENHGDPVHVHCRLADDLADVAAIDKSNYYATPDSPTTVQVSVDTVDGPVSGRVELSTRYGAERTVVEVTLSPPGGDRPPVDVDESLARPQRPTESSDEPSTPAASAVLDRLDAGSVGLFALGLVAVAIAGATAAVVGGMAAVLGFAVIAAGVGVALVLLFR